MSPEAERMNADDLVTHGFGNWEPFSATVERDLLLRIPTTYGVYVVVLPVAQSLRRGCSDVGYIGRAVYQTGLRGRVRQYFHPGPTQSTNRAMRERLDDVTLQLRIGCKATTTESAARRLESDLLLEFESQHGQLPPFNRQRALDRGSRIERGR
jgi:hypothetical protein